VSYFQKLSMRRVSDEKFDFKWDHINVPKVECSTKGKRQILEDVCSYKSQWNQLSIASLKTPTTVVFV
jgi:homoserine kinase